MVVTYEMSSSIITSARFTKVSRFTGLDVGIVIPALNEEKNIEDVLCRLNDFGYDNVLVINSGQSKDNTVKVATEHGEKLSCRAVKEKVVPFGKS